MTSRRSKATVMVGGGKPPTTRQRMTVWDWSVDWITDLADTLSPSSSVNSTLVTGAAQSIHQQQRFLAPSGINFRHLLPPPHLIDAMQLAGGGSTGKFRNKTDSLIYLSWKLFAHPSGALTGPVPLAMCHPPLLATPLKSHHRGIIEACVFGGEWRT